MVVNKDSTQLSDSQRAEILVDTMRAIWDQSKAIIENMNGLLGSLIQKTEFNMIEISHTGKSLTKNKDAFIEFIESIDVYSAQISHYHDLLQGDECSYQVPLMFYKRLRHELVAQVILDRRRIVNLIDRIPITATSSFLFRRWRNELVRFANLDFEPTHVSL